MAFSLEYIFRPLSLISCFKFLFYNTLHLFVRGERNWCSPPRFRLYPSRFSCVYGPPPNEFADSLVLFVIIAGFRKPTNRSVLDV